VFTVKIGTRWRDAMAQHTVRHSEHAALNRLRDVAVARGELCPACYQQREQRGLSHGVGWGSCSRDFHDGYAAI
jgi:hypothetical protein